MPKTWKKPVLRVVTNQNVPKTKERWIGNDPVFFHRSQIKIGARFVNFGRMDHGSLWELRDLYRITENGRRYKITEIEHLNTVCVLLRLGSNETRTMTFANLSYSAIWRLADGNDR